MNRTGAKRLMILARHHMAYKEPKKPGSNAIGWDMDSYRNDSAIREFHPCGTTCCSLGHACTIPEFQKAGLEMHGTTPIFDGCNGSSAGMRFFGIDMDEAYFLFNANLDHSDRTPKQQAREIIKLVKKYHPDLATLEKK